MDLNDQLILNIPLHTILIQNFIWGDIENYLILKKDTAKKKKEKKAA